MSRRARARLDPWETTLAIARDFGHGTPMPSEDESEDADTPAEWWPEPPAEQRTQVGPLDCAGST